MSAKLYFRYGSMGSGKSIELLRTNFNYKEKNQNTFLLTSILDDRYGIGKITTRIGLDSDAEIIDKNTNLFKLIKKKHFDEKYINCVLIDESQFLTKKHIWQLTDVVDNLGIPVICYGLKIDYRGELFEGSKYLLMLADAIDEIRTVCTCGKKATMIVRYLDNKPVFDGEQIIIGGNETYTSYCRKCWKKLKDETKKDLE